MGRTSLLGLACAALTACTTPYSPSVIVKGSPSFLGLADQLSPDRPLDVVLVHGMCTHDKAWGRAAIHTLQAAMTANIAAARDTEASGTIPLAPGVEFVRETAVIDGSKVRMTAIIWSPLTAPLKQQLRYDDTGEPTDCAVDATCKPKRARLNGLAKDTLLNDCLSDAMAYQGASRPVMRDAMVAAFNEVFKDTPADARIVLISASLGSKLSFDALSQMLESGSPGAGQAAAARLGQIFMNANQLPILGLADQRLPGTLATAAAAPEVPADSLQRFLAARSAVGLHAQALTPRLAVIAFTDPNDLLSYRLLPSRYASPQVAVSDVLVSNETTVLGLIERPDTAHTAYVTNPDVASAIACGRPKSARCR